MELNPILVHFLPQYLQYYTNSCSKRCQNMVLKRVQVFTTEFFQRLLKQTKKSSKVSILNYWAFARGQMSSKVICSSLIQRPTIQWASINKSFRIFHIWQLEMPIKLCMSNSLERFQKKCFNDK